MLAAVIRRHVMRRARVLGVVGAFLIGFGPSPVEGGEPPGPHRCHKCDPESLCEPEDFPPADPPNDDLTPREAMGATDVLHADLDLELHFDTSTVSGTCAMTIRSLDPALNEFTFRLRNSFYITAASVTDLQNGSLVSPVVVQTLSTTTRKATLNRAYGLNEQFILTIEYNGTPVNESGSFGSFRWASHGSGTIASSLSESSWAYTWWPIKDGNVAGGGDNADKLTISLHYTVPDTMLATGNGLLQSVETLPGNRRRFNWSSNYPTASYLIEVAATNYTPGTTNPYVSWSRDYVHANGTMPVYFYIYPDNDTPANRAVWDRVPDMMAAYRPRYGEYPFINEKYGIYQMAFSGGMEHQTMTGQGGGGAGGAGNGAFSESVTAHELGHQWWGDMITCRTWHDIWLNEGFATFTEAMWSELRTNPNQPNLAAYLANMNNRRPSDGTLRTNYNGTVYRTDVSNDSSIFSGTYSYNKGAWVLHMLRYMMGDATFFQTLANYRAAFAYGSAVTDDFAAICSQTYGQNLSWFFNQWVYSPGDPDYRWAAQPIVVNGGTYLLVYIKQVQQTQNPSWGVFTMPVELRYSFTPTGGGGPATASRRVWNNAVENWFTVRVDGSSPTGVQFDPDYRLLRPAASTVAFVNGPPTVVATGPAPGEQVPGSAHRNTVSATFHTSVNGASGGWVLVETTTGLVPGTATYDGASNTLTILANGALPNGHYELTLFDSITAAGSGRALDGELANPASAASLPSGNGTPGGNAVIAFDIVREAADINNDQSIDDGDFALFVQVLLGQDSSADLIGRCDFTHDGAADGDDVPPFVAAAILH